MKTFLRHKIDKEGWERQRENLNIFLLRFQNKKKKIFENLINEIQTGLDLL